MGVFEKKVSRRIVFVMACTCALSFSCQSFGFTLWSNNKSVNGTGSLHGPGAYTADQKLFSMILRNLSFTTDKSFLMPLYNNGEFVPNSCSELELLDSPNGRLSDGTAINENADMCSINIAGTDMLVAVVVGGAYQGQQIFERKDDGNMEVRMDLALDLNIGPKGVIKLQFFGTTGAVRVPLSLQSQAGGAGIDQAGEYASGAELRGRIGDLNGDGWIDGTLVSVGNIPLDSPVFPGQPYAMHRHFELNIPVDGLTFGNVEELIEGEPKK